jgi:hypothetical protein
MCDSAAVALVFFILMTFVTGRKAELIAAAASLGVSSSHIRMLGLDDSVLEAAP